MSVQGLLVNAAKETSTTQGTGTYNLAGASAGFDALRNGIANGAQVAYVAERIEYTNGEITAHYRECGLGTLTHGSPDTLARTTIYYSTNGNAAIDWGPGTTDIYCAPPAELMVLLTSALAAGKAGLPLIVNSNSNAFALGNPLPGLTASSTLTIASGSVTPSRAWHLIDTEAAAASDDLTNIVTTNIGDGGLLLLTAANTAHDVVLKHNAGGAGQIYLATATDLTLSDNLMSVMLQRRGSYWYELSRSSITSLPSLTVTGAVAMGGAVSKTGVISPSSISTTQNNYNPAGLSSASIIRQASSANVTITGLAAQADGREIEYRNISAYNHTLSDESASSTAANRFDLPYDLILLPGESVTLKYDGTLSRWRLAHQAQYQMATAAEARAKSSTTKTMSPSNESDLDFESSEISITLSSSGTIAHGKGVKLSTVQAYLRCKTSEGGWSVDEDVPANFFATATPQSSGVIGSSVDATNTRYVVGGAPIYLMNVSTGAYLAITPAKWCIVLKGRC